MQNQLVEESPYGEPVDAIRVRSVIHTSASNAFYATVEETGYKPVITSNQVQQPPRDETSSSKKVKSNVEPVYAKVNKNKKKDKSADVTLNPLYDDIPADLSNPKHPSSLLI
ncbi:uncharacterized protein LOC116287053 [Actinia tenebrosa]|uniref:Uncharacterized protein LOC116287053 n=1 Tax=Actinia tenebrosa TaxID=6105 RepID=A0A6P8H294_ACTTE|nr:uncharacterized protein LOC116287053 [Actinia tenebrosa]